MPVEIFLATSAPCFVSEVNTEPPRPNGESLAMRTASFSSLARNSIETGPKNSQ